MENIKEDFDLRNIQYKDAVASSKDRTAWRQLSLISSTSSSSWWWTRKKGERLPLIRSKYERKYCISFRSDSCKL